MRALKLGKKLSFAADCVAKRLIPQSIVCAHCGSKESTLEERKLMVVDLRRCASCRILFRYPFDTRLETKSAYDGDGTFTGVPSDTDLEQFLQRGFRGRENFASYLEVLRATGVEAGAKIFDYGCSWGYGTLQLKKAGYEARGFEINPSRARFAAERMGLDVRSELQPIKNELDVLFCANVLEHVPNALEVIGWAYEALKPGGLFVAFTRNGSRAFRSARPLDFRRAWGTAYSNCLDDEFYSKAFLGVPLLLASAPYHSEKLREWDKASSVSHSLAGNELCAIAVKLPNTSPRGIAS